jgi:hypothetical protein
MSEKGQVELTSYITLYIYIYVTSMICWIVMRSPIYIFQTRLPMVIKPMTNPPFGSHFFNHYNMPCVNFLTYDTRWDQTLHLLCIQQSFNHPTIT